MPRGNIVAIVLDSQIRWTDTLQPTHQSTNNTFPVHPPKFFGSSYHALPATPSVPFFTFQSIIFKHFFLSLLFPPRCEPVLDSHHQSHPSIHHHCVAVWRISYSYPYFPVPASHFMSFLIPKDIPIPKQKTENKKQEQPPPSSAAPLSSSSHK